MQRDNHVKTKRNDSHAIQGERTSRNQVEDFFEGPVVKTSPSVQEGVGLISGQG